MEKLTFLNLILLFFSPPLAAQVTDFGQLNHLKITRYKDLKEGETYFMIDKDSDGSYDEKVIKIRELDNEGQLTYSGANHGRGALLYSPSKFAVILIHDKDGHLTGEKYHKNAGGYIYTDLSSSEELTDDQLIRHATPDEKAWLEKCITADKFISKDKALEQAPAAEQKKSPMRGEVKGAKITLNRESFLHKGKTDGWGFSFVPFRYQFVNCGGEVQVMVDYERKAEYIVLIHNNTKYYSGSAPELWPRADQIQVGDVQAKLYYGESYLGDVKLNYIVGNFAGCFGETYNVVKDVGRDPTKKEYRENINKFSLRDIIITSGDVTINYEKKQEIIKAVSYDAFGNSKGGKGTKAGNVKKQDQQYDAFGNPTGKAPAKKENKKKYDAFGNPIN